MLSWQKRAVRMPAIAYWILAALLVFSQVVLHGDGTTFADNAGIPIMVGLTYIAVFIVAGETACAAEATTEQFRARNWMPVSMGTLAFFFGIAVLVAGVLIAGYSWLWVVVLGAIVMSYGMVLSVRFNPGFGR